MSLHGPIFLHDLSLVLPQKICFEGFSACIHPGERIALLGANGCGKSTLLKALAGEHTLVGGHIHRPPEARVAYVPQFVTEGRDGLSGGEKFNAALTQALVLEPKVLLLDEPTNHLDEANRRSLRGLLRRFTGTLVIATHDTLFLEEVAHTLWAMAQGRIEVCTGTYEAYRQELAHQQEALERELHRLSFEKKRVHRALMEEQERAKTSRMRGQKAIAERKWPTIRSSAKVGRGNETAGRKSAQIQDKRNQALHHLKMLRLPEVLCPTFHFPGGSQGPTTLVQITEGGVAYSGVPLLQNIHLHIERGERVALEGANGSGKTTLLKALMNTPGVERTGEWCVVDLKHVGYFDQHYHMLGEGTLLSALSQQRSDWCHREVRAHLNSFLFRKNEEVNAPLESLSGGEKVRACLALLAAKPPQLLLLDEITNNLDGETKNYVKQALKDYPGALLMISHEREFLEDMGVDKVFRCEPCLSSPLSFP